MIYYNTSPYWRDILGIFTPRFYLEHHGWVKKIVIDYEYAVVKEINYL